MDLLDKSIPAELQVASPEAGKAVPVA